MTGYKGFDKDLKCRDKQYEVGQTYEESEARLCNKGLHFCEHPLDCLEYYPVGENRYAEIEADGVSKETDNDTKRVAKKLIIKAELSLKGLIEAAVKFTFEKAGKVEKGYFSKLAASGYSSKLAASGYSSKLAASGHSSQLAASGHSSKLAASGDSSQLAASGYSSKLAASGHSSKVEAKGENSVAASIGIKGVASGALGCWIVLSEWQRDTDIIHKIKCVKTAKVDGKKIKVDTPYFLKDGKFVEVTE